MIVVLFDPRRPSLVPIEAIEHLTGEVRIYRGDARRGALVAARGASGAHRRGRAGVAVVGPQSPRRHGAIGRRRAADFGARSRRAANAWSTPSR